MAPLRIVHTVSSLLNGGMEHFVVRLATAQRARGHDARIVAIKTGPLVDQAEALGIPVDVLQRSGKADRILRGAVSLGGARADIIHAHNTTSLHYAVLGKLLSGARIVFTDHAQISRVPRAFEWYLTDAAVAVSAHNARTSLANGVLREVLVVHNGVQVEPPRRGRAEVRAELGLGDEPVAIHVARFVPLKAQDVIVRALSRLQARGARLTVVFVGDGPEQPGVARLAAELGLGEGRARFLGFRTDVADLLGAADIFLLPSRTEGFPLSVLEAMAHRLPVVTTPVGGVPELCTEGENALLVPVDDDEALAAAMERLAGDAPLRQALGAAGYARISADFSFDGMARRYEDIYREVLAQTAWQRLGTLGDRLRRGEAPITAAR
jgi:glycosyltransferase involved in cell wall biosynthesis